MKEQINKMLKEFYFEHNNNGLVNIGLLEKYTNAITKLKNLGEGEAETGYVLLSDVNGNKKINLELNYVNSKIFLNFWDNIHGNDICVQVIGNGLFTDDGEMIDFNEYIERVEKIVDDRH